MTVPLAFCIDFQSFVAVIRKSLANTYAAVEEQCLSAVLV